MQEKLDAGTPKSEGLRKGIISSNKGYYFIPGQENSNEERKERNKRGCHSKQNSTMVTDDLRGQKGV